MIDFKNRFTAICKTTLSTGKEDAGAIFSRVHVTLYITMPVHSSIRPSVRPSVRPSIHPSVRPSVRPSVITSHFEHLELRKNKFRLLSQPSCHTTPAHPHATYATLYKALFKLDLAPLFRPNILTSWMRQSVKTSLLKQINAGKVGSQPSRSPLQEGKTCSSS